MRYTFSQLLQYQNKRNAECDQSKVDAVVDEFLADLEKHVKFYPTRKRMVKYRYTSPDNKWVHSIADLTVAERNKIIEVLSDLGFREVEFKPYNQIGDESIEISWE